MAFFWGEKTPSFINSIYLFASDFSAYWELMFAGLTGHSYLGDSRQATCKSPLPFDLVHYCNNRLFYSSKPEIHIFNHIAIFMAAILAASVRVND